MNRGRPIEFNRDQAATAAMQVFWARGYQATSLRDLTAAMALSKSSLYQAFGDKESLFVDCLGRYRDQLLERLEARLEKAATARSFLRELFLEAADTAATDQADLGCLIFNSAVELGDGNSPAARQASASVRRISALFARAIERGRQEGSIDSALDSQALGDALTAGMAGLRTLIKSGVSRARARAAAQALLGNLD